MIYYNQAVLHGELQSLDSKLMRGAEPVVRVLIAVLTILLLLTFEYIMAQNVEPCQGGNTAALRQPLWV